ncbi:hypothetical protein [Agrobacterium tumefaciens]|uniref:hypothetical protein n=1 Tax=Agrobacterium tumefaciens TaxID=358 RepID=UPI00287BF634|nr:hypothetical protein [Agrobacterium tumefaciens]MDS7594953.1 hypothetical protein [Agrobacterium tumefaciens]
MATDTLHKSLCCTPCSGDQDRKSPVFSVHPDPRHPWIRAIRRDGVALLEESIGAFIASRPG